MITKIKLENFRNHKSFECDLTKCSIISGQNGIGKSNILSAISWFVGEYVLTDKWGSGEKDMIVNVPIDLKKGDFPSVTLYIQYEDATLEFTKQYKPSYDKETGKAKWHSVGLVNGKAYKNMTLWQDDLNKYLDYSPTLKGMREEQLFTDPLYLLQKMDAKDLRAFLVMLGCDVSNDEMYSKGFEDLKKYESKYLGNFTAMKEDLQTRLKATKEAMSKYTILLESKNDIEEFNPAVLEELQKSQSELTIKLNELSKGGANVRLNEISNEIDKLQSQQLTEIERFNNEKAFNIKHYEKLIEMAKSKESDAKYKATQDLREQKTNKINELNSLDMSIANYSRIVESCKSQLESFKQVGINATNTKNSLLIKRSSVEEMQFKDMAKCPCCGFEFPTSADALEHFNQDKANQLIEIDNQIEFQSKIIEDAKTKCTSAVDEGKKAKSELEALRIKRDLIPAEIDALNTQIQVIDNEPYSNPELDDYKACLDEAKAKVYSNPELANNLLKLQQELLEVNRDSAMAVISEKESIQEQLNEIVSQIANENVKKAQWDKKVEEQAVLEKLTVELNNIESLSYRVQEYLNAMIQTINDRATELTGLEFVMLEENRTNNNLSQVCYAKVDGVPFSQCNTSKKLEVGIKFIARIKDIVSAKFNVKRNNLPILADKLEGFDFESKIKELCPNDQLVCTRVGIEEVITVK